MLLLVVLIVMIVVVVVVVVVVMLLLVVLIVVIVAVVEPQLSEVHSCSWSYMQPVPQQISRATSASVHRRIPATAQIPTACSYVFLLPKQRLPLFEAHLLPLLEQQRTAASPVAPAPPALHVRPKFFFRLPFSVVHPSTTVKLGHLVVVVVVMLLLVV